LYCASVNRKEENIEYRVYIDAEHSQQSGSSLLRSRQPRQRRWTSIGSDGDGARLLVVQWPCIWSTAGVSKAVTVVFAHCDGFELKEADYPVFCVSFRSICLYQNYQTEVEKWKAMCTQQIIQSCHHANSSISSKLYFFVWGMFLWCHFVIYIYVVLRTRYAIVDQVYWARSFASQNPKNGKTTARARVGTGSWYRCCFAWVSSCSRVPIRRKP